MSNSDNKNLSRRVCDKVFNVLNNINHFKQLVECKFTNCKAKLTLNRPKGYSNLLSHLKTYHKYWINEVINKNDENIPINENLSEITQKVSNIYYWICFIVDGNNAFNKLDKPETRLIAKTTISSKTAKLYVLSGFDPLAPASGN